MTFREIINSQLLLETVRKIGDRYYVYSHEDPNKRLGRKEGYASANQAIAAILGMKSKGGFYNKSTKIKQAMIRAYKKRHGL